MPNPMVIISLKHVQFGEERIQCVLVKCFRKSGGLGVFVRNELSEFIMQVDSESDYIMWLKINKMACKTNEDLYIVVVYVPPSYSRFNTIDETNIFNVEVANICIDNTVVFKWVILMHGRAMRMIL